jgi:3-isopropylmalate dehydrogenase
MAALTQMGVATFAIERGLVGGAAYDAHGRAISEADMAKAMAADAVIFGAVGGPKWDAVPYEVRPEAGLLRLRKDLALFANLRPAICYPALADASSLKREIVDGLDIVIVRELTGGVYFGEPKQIIDLGNGQKRGIDTQVYDTYEIERIGRVAFELARKRRNKVTSSEKRNVMKSGVLWNEVTTALHKRDYADVTLEHQLADSLAMQLVRWPKQFDVIVTDNLFGDMLSDIAAMLTGSLGMLPSASLGEVDPKTRKRRALYEPVHGSAPDIAGQGLANPIPSMMARPRTRSRRRLPAFSTTGCGRPTSRATRPRTSRRAKWAMRSWRSCARRSRSRGMERSCLRNTRRPGPRASLSRPSTVRSRSPFPLQEISS